MAQKINAHNFQGFRGSRIRVTGKKGKSIAHRVRHRTTEDVAGSRRFRVFMVDELTGLNKLIE